MFGPRTVAWWTLGSFIDSRLKGDPFAVEGRAADGGFWQPLQGRQGRCGGVGEVTGIAKLVKVGPLLKAVGIV